MVNVSNSLCIYEGCETRPTYNILVEKTALYCKENKLDNMTDIMNIKKICKYDGCSTRETYNFKEQKK
jgi:hypothetical protein